MWNFLTFRRMMIPYIIHVIFWGGIAISIVLGIIFLAAGHYFFDNYAKGASIGILILIFGPVYVRIICELMMLPFRMNETLTDIKSILEQSQVLARGPLKTLPEPPPAPALGEEPVPAAEPVPEAQVVPDQIFCPQCGHKNGGTAKFCSKCGHDLR
jgi:hypothetical protein